MDTRGAKLIAGIGVAGSLASVAALFVGQSASSPPAAAPAPAVVQPASAAAVPAAVPAKAGPEPLRLPPVSELLFSEARELLLRQGWFPINSPVNPMAREDYLSGNTQYFTIDRGWRELVNCSGTGLAPCKFAYRSEAGQYLYVVTVGEEEMARVNDLWITTTPEES